MRPAAAQRGPKARNQQCAADDLQDNACPKQQAGLRHAPSRHDARQQRPICNVADAGENECTAEQKAAGNGECGKRVFEHDYLPCEDGRMAALLAN
jgi:hypothetical protein